MNRIYKRSLEASKSFRRRNRFFRMLHKEHVVSLAENEFFKNFEND